MDHTVVTLQTHHTCPYLVSVHQMVPTLSSDSNHLIAAYNSFIDPRRMKGWVGLAADPYKWLSINCRSETKVLRRSYTTNNRTYLRNEKKRHCCSDALDRHSRQRNGRCCSDLHPVFWMNGLRLFFSDCILPAAACFHVCFLPATGNTKQTNFITMM